MVARVIHCKSCGIEADQYADGLCEACWKNQRRGKHLIPFTETDIREYLDRSIRYWRKKRDEGNALAPSYIDAFQSVRTTLFGRLLEEK